MDNEKLRLGMFNLRADLTATNLAIDAICAAMQPEVHKQLMSAWSALTEAHAETMAKGGAAPETRAAMTAAVQRMQTRLARGPAATQYLKRQDD